jgi:hypothetical protein
LRRGDAVYLGSVENVGNDDFRLFQFDLDLDGIAPGVEFGLAGDGIDFRNTLRKHPILHRRSMFSLPDLIPGFPRLVERHPAIVSVSLHHEHKDVDAAIPLAGGGIDRHHGLAGDPRLLPGGGAGLDLFDEFVRHLLVERFSGLHWHCMYLRMNGMKKENRRNSH